MSDSVSKVGENIFEGTEFINSLKPDEYGCIYLGNLLLKANDTKEYVKIKDSTKAIAAKAFINNIRIKNVDLPLGLIEIEDSTFEGCRTLESVIIPQGVKYLGEYAFLNSGLKRVVLPAGLEEISYGAFKDCYNLVEINLPSSIIDIKGGSFYGTKYLDSIKEDEYGCKYKENILLEYTGKSAEKIEIKAGTRLIAGSAFNNAESIKEVYIPKSVDHIGRYTFTKCHNLEKVEFEEDGKFYATKSVKKHMKEELTEQKQISDITIRIKNIFFPLKDILKRGAECGIELRDVARDKNGKVVYDAILINNIVVGKFDCPLQDGWTKETKTLVRSPFFGKWNVTCGDTFICSNGSTKTFLVLSK